MFRNSKSIYHFRTHPPSSNNHSQIHHNSSGGSPMDIDMDSPFSPGSASDLSDLFEPPTASPPSSSLPKIGTGIRNKSKKASDSKAWQSIIGETDKHNHNRKSQRSANKQSTSGLNTFNFDLSLILEFRSRF